MLKVLTLMQIIKYAPRLKKTRRDLKKKIIMFLFKELLE